MSPVRRVAGACVALFGLALHARADDAIRIGVLNDRSGPYAAISGTGSVVAAQLAAEDFGGVVAGRRIEIVSADHQNKPDVGAAVARRWIEVEGVGAIADVVTSSVALAVQRIAGEKGAVLLSTGAGSDELAGSACSPTSFVWTWDAYALTHAVTRALASAGRKDWYLIEVDYALGKALDRGVRSALEEVGGSVVGVSQHPLGTPDFSSYLLKAQESRAPIVGILNGGNDSVTAVKQAGEFGITRTGTQQVVAVAMLSNDVKALGLQDAQGLRVTESFYWDLNDRTRAWSERFAARMNGAMPSMIQAGTYSAVRHYLRAIEATGSFNAKGIAAAMRAMSVDDATVASGSRIREDGRLMRDFFVFRVKAPSESTGAWDIYERIATVPAQEAAVATAKSSCPMLSNR